MKFLILAFVILLPTIVYGGDYRPMVNIPGIDGRMTMEGYLNAVYIFSISVAAILAVLKITLAGVKYVMSDIVTSKESAKKDVQGAIFGLLIVLAAVLILTTINSELVVFDIFRSTR